MSGSNNGQGGGPMSPDKLRIAELENRVLNLSDRIEELISVITRHERKAAEQTELVVSAIKVAQILETELKDLHAANMEQLRRARGDGSDNIEHLVPYLNKAANCLNQRNKARDGLNEALQKMRDLGVL